MQKSAKYLIFQNKGEKYKVLLSGYPVSVWPPFGILDLLAVPLWTTQDHDGTQRLVLAFDGLDLFALDDPGVCDALPGDLF